MARGKRIDNVSFVKVRRKRIGNVSFVKAETIIAENTEEAHVQSPQQGKAAVIMFLLCISAAVGFFGIMMFITIQKWRQEEAEKEKVLSELTCSLLVVWVGLLGISVVVMCLSTFRTAHNESQTQEFEAVIFYAAVAVFIFSFLAIALTLSVHKLGLIKGCRDVKNNFEINVKSLNSQEDIHKSVPNYLHELNFLKYYSMIGTILEAHFYDPPPAALSISWLQCNTEIFSMECSKAIKDLPTNISILLAFKMEEFWIMWFGTPAYILWYLQALFSWILLIPLWMNLKYPLFASIVLSYSVLICTNSIFTPLSTSNAIKFWPFFVFGASIKFYEIDKRFYHFSKSGLFVYASWIMVFLSLAFSLWCPFTPGEFILYAAVANIGNHNKGIFHELASFHWLLLFFTIWHC
eukprot:jgi/Bigna1/89923/estExt_fgenesh1_pg.C_580063